MLVWEASDPYLYFRMGEDGRLIVGGEDEADPRCPRGPGQAEAQMRDHRREAEAACSPSIEFEIDYSWAGAFGESATGLPSIAPVPDMDHAWAVMGFGGNGITYSVIASQIVGGGGARRSDPDADLYPWVRWTMAI